MVGGVTDRHWFEDRDERLDAAALTGAQEVSRKGFSQPSRLFFSFCLIFTRQTAKLCCLKNILDLSCHPSQDIFSISLQITTMVSLY